ncbi:zinc finger matrin-type protein 4-like [Chanos chanos]|uniref:Zinc finger matrin-type protein 4-like n=1 Tax=Chanos chanos TaxID=29144 RepID=A0A6J2VP90_CHACN|nr:zinc finger matrin-type protein 4-like [Chanos chanos]
MKPAGVREGSLFTESYCTICNAQLISQSQRVAHYESKKHANKVRLFYMLHPEDGGPPSKRLRPDNPDSADTEVDRNKCCTLCNMFFTSPVVAQSHYQGKTHAKRVRLVQGGQAPQPNVKPCTDNSPSAPPPPQAPPISWSLANSKGEAGKFCCLCGAWFNNPLMAQQHYGGKKHKRNASRARLLEQLAGNLDATATAGLQSSYSCSVCTVTLNSIEQYHAHLHGSKHQTKYRRVETGIAVWRPVSPCGDRYRRVETGITVWRQVSLCGDQYRRVETGIAAWRQVSPLGDRYRCVETGIAVWRQVSPCGDRYRCVETGIAVWRQVSPCGDRYRRVETGIAVWNRYRCVETGIAVCLGEIKGSLACRFYLFRVEAEIRNWRMLPGKSD